MLDLFNVTSDCEEELHGLLDGMEARAGGQVYVSCFGRTIDDEDVVALNFANELGNRGCSSFAAWGTMTPGGRTIVARNDDNLASSSLLGIPQYIRIHIPPAGSGRCAFVSVQYPGVIGFYQGMNTDGVTITRDGGNSQLDPTISSGFYSSMLTLHEALGVAHTGTAFDDVEAILKARPIPNSSIVIVAVPHAGQGPSSVALEWDAHLATDGGVTRREPSSLHSYLIATNHFRARQTEIDCWRYSLLSDRMAEIAQSSGMLLFDTDEAWGLLRQVALGPPHCADPSIVFEPDRGLLHIAFSRDSQAAPFCSPMTVDVTGISP